MTVAQALRAAAARLRAHLDAETAAFEARLMAAHVLGSAVELPRLKFCRHCV